MGAAFELKVPGGLVLDHKAFDANNADKVVLRFPDLTLLEFHRRQFIKSSDDSSNRVRVGTGAVETDSGQTEPKNYPRLRDGCVNGSHYNPSDDRTVGTRNRIASRGCCEFSSETLHPRRKDWR